jgi:hypothetical protein
LRSAFAFASFQKYENTIRNQIRRSRPKNNNAAKPKHSSANAPQKNYRFKKIVENNRALENIRRAKILPNPGRLSRKKTDGPRDTARERFGEIHNQPR